MSTVSIGCCDPEVPLGDVVDDELAELEPEVEPVIWTS